MQPELSVQIVEFLRAHGRVTVGEVIKVTVPAATPRAALPGLTALRSPSIVAIKIAAFILPGAGRIELDPALCECLYPVPLGRILVALCKVP